MKTKLAGGFEKIVSTENLLEAWREFLNGKRGKRDVQEFELRLMDNILSLRADLLNGQYKHGGYHAFNISDPKPRNIHKAAVRDRLVHHALYRVLYPFFDKKFIADSYSCRNGKGLHKAMNRFRSFTYQVSKNHTRTVWVLKCDIRKFFASIDHATLKHILAEHILDADVLNLLSEVIDSFPGDGKGIGLPLGNLTSQLLVNIYMNEFDQFVKHRLKAKYYIRYADDFVILSTNKEWLKIILTGISNFLKNRLCLDLHPDKVFIKSLSSGIDFLGWVHFPGHRVLRTITTRRMMKRIELNPQSETVASYRGLLKHGNTGKLNEKMTKKLNDI